MNLTLGELVVTLLAILIAGFFFLVFTGNNPTALLNNLISTNNFTLSSRTFNKIEDKYTSVEQVTEALQNAGLESCNLIIGIDYTKSNEYTGRSTFDGRCLHQISDEILNPYQQVIKILGKTLEKFDEDGKIPAYGFGDLTTKGTRIFPFFLDSRPCNGFEEVLQRYNEITPYVLMSGPTNFAPLIYEAINIVKKQRDFHLLVIIADGLVTSEQETVDAIVEASKYPLSILVVGVGDGPFDKMREFDDGLPQRQFDNFQFVSYHEVIASSLNREASFALHALMELPEQYQTIVNKLKLL